MDDVKTAILEYVRSSISMKSISDGEILETELRELIDSIAMMDFLSFLETKFNLVISDDEVTPETFETVSSSIAYVSRKLALKSGTVG